MFDVAKDTTRYRLVRYAAMVTFVVPAALLAGCAREEVVAPAPQPAAVYQPPPPPPAPPPPRVVGERG